MSVRRFLAEEEAQGLAEYALIMVLISIIAMAALSTVGLEVVNLTSWVGQFLSTISS